MKRLLYLLLAAASFTGAAPVSPFDVGDLDGDDDAPGIVDSTHRARQASSANGSHAGVVVLPLKSDDEELIGRPDGVAGSLVVDRSDGQVAVIRGVGHDEADAGAGPMQLLHSALRDAQMRGDLKVVIDLPLPLEHVKGVCDANRFTYSRTVRRGGRAMHEFIADLYTSRLTAT